MVNLNAWIMVKELNDMNYSLKKMNLMDYGSKEPR